MLCRPGEPSRVCNDLGGSSGGLRPP